ncbi:twitching motility protein PilT [Brevundimonas sp. LM2]|uniref:type II toxin-antitoxin system VapC family toxin n=1 Tax=Brevundimonas sp. LM2 TaxID=1938605 RepID=UPI000983DE57|nr:type II toxin-antitoxin system VapC family toxin [Brevundimonas sp. LM2]AQR61626.1 twitching motility protein PilT [Brevundimonas sp. LM2]
MRLLLDTQLLIWASDLSPRLSRRAADLIEDPDNDLHFSVASIWETAIKFGLGRPDFHADPRVLRPGLLAAGFREVQVTARHALTVLDLPRLHGDPFDRMLVAQARNEGLVLLTSDRLLDGYPGDIRRV